VSYTRPDAQCRASFELLANPVKKTVDVYLRDRLVASYPVVVQGIDQPTDDDFIQRVKRQMRSYYSSDDISTARFLVRSLMN
jgi:hypothetical protein